MSKSRDAFRTISEVADWLDTPAHVLRFWESKFSQVKPIKRAGGRRYYRPADMALLAGIKKLLHEDGLTIKGAQKVLREQGVKYVSGLSTMALDTDDDLHEGDAPYVEVEPPEPEQTLVSFAEASAARASAAQAENADDAEAPAVETPDSEPVAEPMTMAGEETAAASAPLPEDAAETADEWSAPPDELAAPVTPEPAEADSAAEAATAVTEMPPDVAAVPDEATDSTAADTPEPDERWANPQRDMFESPGAMATEPATDPTEPPAEADTDADAVTDPQLAADMNDAAPETADERSEVFATGIVVEDMPPPEEPSATSAADDTPPAMADMSEARMDELEPETTITADPDSEPEPLPQAAIEAGPESEPEPETTRADEPKQVPAPQPLPDVPLTAQQRAERIMAGAHPHAPGPLSLLDRVERLTPEQAQALRAALPRLKALHDRLTAPQD
ncbi:MerR family transcriptional regulator [Thetidibacter halocola]|uniref:MerR family transcriptional regulator n=1 Tax=Thetidibacter halocola TaxID=2827239 RepID=A0A8J7WCB1_9RHOB|nr:MerR family transcriptional regulator [Thetidibacter halocola]MBS0122786.1 MerR family transcriptional regulator [Thetidibacter halocola]